MTTELLPENEEAENCLLGSLFQDSDYAPRVCMMLQSSDFNSPLNRGIYDGILNCVEADRSISVSTVVAEGGDIVRASLLEDYVPTATACMHWADEVRRASLVRSIYKYGHSLINAAKLDNDQEDIDAVLSGGYEDLLGFNQGGDDIFTGDGIGNLCESIKQKRGNPGIHGIRTLFPLFDNVVKGLKTVNIISAKSGFGKTATAIQIFYNIAVKQQIPALYLNFEMEADELVERMIATGSQVQLDHVQTGDMTDEEAEKADVCASGIVGSPAFISGCQAKTIDNTLNLIHQYARKEHIQVVFIDYIGEITAQNDELTQGTYAVYGEWIQRIKNTCSRLGIKAVILSQVNRTGYSESPEMENIAGSMQIVQKANVMIALYGTKEQDFMMKIIKNRGGPCNIEIPLHFNRKCQHISELNNQEEVPF